MDAKITPNQIAGMTKPTNQTKIMIMRSKDQQSGFTLVELLVASAIAALLSAITWSILIENTKGNMRSEFRRRLYQDWNQATSLLQSEIAMSDWINSTNVSDEDIPEDKCKLLRDSNSRLKLQMHLVGALPKIIYGTRTIGSLPEYQRNKWMGSPDDGILIRCGPEREIGTDGKAQYRNGTYQESVILDNLNLSSGDGLEIIQAQSGQKLVEFTLSMNEEMRESSSQSIRTKTFGSSAISKINDIQHVPSETSVCQTICKTKDVNCGHGSITLLNTSKRFYEDYYDESVFGTTTICTNRSVRLGDGIRGDNRNYVMDGEPTPNRSGNHGVILEGGIIGRNILLGTSNDDTLRGGDDNDGLIGRGGRDFLFGGKGNDNFVPWPSASKQNSDVNIDGGENFDRVYLDGSQSSYSRNACTNSSCNIRSNSGGTLYLSNVEMVIYNDHVENLER